MGDPLMDVSGLGDAVDGKLERLVTLNAFYIDTTEVTVGAFRSAGLARAGDPVTATTAGCTYPVRSDDASADALPINCVSFSLARDYCTKRGADLPTEAEFEYVAGGLRSGAFVWGDDALRCGDAVVGHASCPEPTVRAVGSAKRDTLTLAPGSVVFDIVGNVHELTRDLWNPENGPCWGTGHFENPVCTTPDARLPLARTVRGGAYADLPSYARAALREFVDQPDVRVGTSVGFRCVRR